MSFIIIKAAGPIGSSLLCLLANPALDEKKAKAIIFQQIH